MRTKEDSAYIVNQLQYMEYGITFARRGWLEASKLLNSLNLKDF